MKTRIFAICKLICIAASFLIGEKNAVCQNSSAIVEVHTTKFVDSTIIETIIGDRVLTAYGKNEDYNNSITPPRKIYTTVNDGVIKIEIPNLTERRFITFGKIIRGLRQDLNEVGLYDYIYLTGGDSVVICERNGEISYSGKSAARFKAAMEIAVSRRAAWRIFRLLMDSLSLNDKGIVQCYKDLDKFTLLEIRTIDKQQQLEEKNLLKTLTIANNQMVKHAFWNFRGKTKASDFAKVYEIYHENFWTDSTVQRMLTDSLAGHSIAFLRGIQSGYFYDSCLGRNKIFDIAGYYRYIVQMTAGSLREWLIYRLISENLNKDGGTGAIAVCIGDAIAHQFIANEAALSELKKWRSTNIEGVSAFNFSLHDTSGKIRHLADFRGRVLLLDFWFIGCRGCIGIQPMLDSVIEQLKGKPFTLLSICLDDRATIEDWLKEIKRGVYTKKDHENLFANTKSEEGQEVRDKYKIDYAPLLIVIDKFGKIAAKPSTAAHWMLTAPFLLSSINRSM